LIARAPEPVSHLYLGGGLRALAPHWRQRASRIRDDAAAARHQTIIETKRHGRGGLIAGT
jgi:hypothetical protein